MKELKTIIVACGLIAAGCMLQSCNDDDDDVRVFHPTALVTVRPGAGDGFEMQLDNVTTLRSTNLKASPFGNKEVRALVNYDEVSEDARYNIKNVFVNWMDSIRTKQPVPTAGDDNTEKYGNDAIEIVKDWVTVAEDGYLTLRIRTIWGAYGRVHHINLLQGVNPDNPYEFELRHDARGDLLGYMGDALVAFNLNQLPDNDGSEKKIKINWKSFSGPKSAEFDMQFHRIDIPDGVADALRNGGKVE